MTGDAVAVFFEDLAGRGYDPLLSGVSGTVRFDLLSGKTTERWLIAIRKGNLAVSRRNVAADTIVRMSRTLFEAVASGETNLLPEMLRGEVVLEGDYRLMILVRRTFRRRLAVRQPETAAGHARRRR